MLSGSEVSRVNPFENCKYELVKLGEVCEVLIGGTPTRSNYSYFQGSNLWVSIAEMNGQVITDTKEKISDEAIKKSNVKLIPKDTTLLSFKLSIGKTAIAGKDLYTNEAIAGLIPKDKLKILDKYLFWFFEGKILNLNSLRGNNAFGKSLNITILKEQVQIPLPPLEIQKQIVSECEKVEEQYNTIRMSIEEYQKLIKAILVKTGICEEASISGGGGDNASSLDWQNIDTTIALILKELESLQSKLDFAFLESLACRIEYSEVSHQSIARSATESRPLRGAEIVDKGGATASARLELEAEERGTPLNPEKAATFSGLRGAGRG
ncbi:hypothetical protein LS78_009215 [Helicobacter bilis]|nr:hypothetical protein LS78_009215 [Helicobacter bilis]